MALDSSKRAELRRFLLNHFDLTELKDLAFDLGVDYQRFSHETTRDLSRELIAYFERRGQQSCLVTEVLRQRPDNYLVQLLAKLPSCTPNKKVQIILPNDMLDDEAGLLASLAELFDVSEDKVMLIGAVGGSMRLLIGLPEKAADLLIASGINSLGDGTWSITLIACFESLSLASQNTWRLIACDWPPIRQGNALRPAISWIDALERELDISLQANDTLERELKTRLDELERVSERIAQLKAANEELGDFTLSLSHDLRAPLRTIYGFSQALLDDYTGQLDDTGQDYLRRVQRASQRMGQLIDDVLQLSRVTRSEMHPGRVDLSDMAWTVAIELQQTQPERQVGFIIADEMEADGDEQLLRVVLKNLLGNAWRFTGKRRQAQIEFGRVETAAPPTYFVRDNGAGFDMTYADKLFGIFQRLHSTSEFEGTGIGLASVQRIIHRHGGRVWAEGKVGQGATFYFTLE